MWPTRQVALSRPSAYVAPFHWLLPRQSRVRHALGARLSGPQEHHAHCALYPYGCYSLRRIVALAAHHAPTTDRRVRLGLLLRRNAKSHTRLLPYSDCECFLHECVPDTDLCSCLVYSPHRRGWRTPERSEFPRR